MNLDLNSDLSRQDLAHVLSKVKVKYQTMETLEDYKELFSKVELSLECPICYMIPRESPIPCCPAGHIVCVSCRTHVSSCPTCRRGYSSNTSSVVASLLEVIPHKCKYSVYGCEVKMNLNQIVKHEEKCKDRTIVCPFLPCSEVVPLKKFSDHASKKGCSIDFGTKRIFGSTLSEDYLKWDGKSKEIGDEFDLDQSNCGKLFSFVCDSKRFYFICKYFGSDRKFVFNVMMVENFGVVGDLSVRMTISNKDGSRKLCGEWPVISIEDLKDDSPDCFKVDYDSMKPLLRIDNIGEENSGRWKVGFKVKVDINGRRLSSVFGFD